MLGAKSPILSWTRSPTSTPNCGRGCESDRRARYRDFEDGDSTPDVLTYSARHARCAASAPMPAPVGGRSVEIADNELLQQRLRKRAATSAGRQELRERVTVEHRQAHTCRRQGRHARFIGSRKNEFDLRRAAAISNLEVIQRRLEAQAVPAESCLARAA
jgi:hypothetical protein